MTTGLLLSGLAISTVGLALFVYGRKVQDLPSLGAGLLLMVFPFFVHSVVLMWIVAAACGAAVFALRRAGTMI